MSDPASHVNELRLLELKKLRGGLSPEEEAHRASLSGVVPTSAPRGFDVRAAAAQVRALLDSAPATPPEAVPVKPATAAAFAPALPVVLPPAAPPEADPRQEACAVPLSDAWSTAAPDPTAAAGEEGARDPGAAPAAPVYDAAAYGLDPNDPDAAAWAAWYAEQGWDPATAYAYAQQMNAQYETDASGAGAESAACDRGAGELLAQDPSAVAPPAIPEATPGGPEEIPDLLPEDELSSAAASPAHGDVAAADEHAGPRESLDGLLATPPGEDATAFTPMSSGEALREIPPLELEALDGPLDEPAAVGPGEPDVAVDLWPTFGDPAPADGLADPEGAEPPLEVTDASAAAAPSVDWAEHAVPAGEEPVDFTAFEAEPAAATPAPEGGREAEQTAMWEFPAALRQDFGAELPAQPDVSAGAADEFTPADLAGSAVEMPLLETPPLPEEGNPPSVPAAGIGGERVAESLEPPPPELLEIQDDDILEVGDAVVEVAEAATADPLQTSGGAPPEEAVLPPPDIEPLNAVEAVEFVTTPLEETSAFDPPPPLEPTLAFDPPPLEPAADELEPSPLVPALNTTAEPFPEPETQPFPEPEPQPLPVSYVSGTHRVVVHTADGQVKRGTVSDLALESGEVLLTAQGGLAAESIAVEQIKAIFFMLPPGAEPAEPDGRKVRVTFRDGRQVAGFSADYAPERFGFFMVPADTRTHTARIWVYRAAVRQVSIS